MIDNKPTAEDFKRYTKEQLFSWGQQQYNLVILARAELLRRTGDPLLPGEAPQVIEPPADTEQLDLLNMDRSRV